MGMLLASRQLLNARGLLMDLASTLGYDSESAFGKPSSA